jgi:hypothetical protein
VVCFCLEFDNGTENLARLVDKLAGYADLGIALGEAPLVLFALQGARREAAAAKALARSPVRVATAVVPAGTSPAGPRWMLAGDAQGLRRRLVDLDACEARAGK